MCVTFGFKWLAAQTSSDHHTAARIENHGEVIWKNSCLKFPWICAVFLLLWSRIHYDNRGLSALCWAPPERKTGSYARFWVACISFLRDHGATWEQRGARTWYPHGVTQTAMSLTHLDVSFLSLWLHWPADLLVLHPKFDPLLGTDIFGELGSVKCDKLCNRTFAKDFLVCSAKWWLMQFSSFLPFSSLCGNY